MSAPAWGKGLFSPCSRRRRCWGPKRGSHSTGKGAAPGQSRAGQVNRSGRRVPPNSPVRTGPGTGRTRKGLSHQHRPNRAPKGYKGGRYHLGMRARMLGGRSSTHPQAGQGRPQPSTALPSPSRGWRKRYAGPPHRAQMPNSSADVPSTAVMLEAPGRHKSEAGSPGRWARVCAHCRSTAAVLLTAGRGARAFGGAAFAGTGARAFGGGAFAPALASGRKSRPRAMWMRTRAGPRSGDDARRRGGVTGVAPRDLDLVIRSPCCDLPKNSSRVGKSAGSPPPRGPMGPKSTHRPVGWSSRNLRPAGQERTTGRPTEPPTPDVPRQSLEFKTPTKGIGVKPSR